jgi:hypothetical protein
MVYVGADLHHEFSHLSVLDGEDGEFDRRITNILCDKSYVRAGRRPARR